ncbi:hypothetical protein ACU4HD_12200 [Cupriavidus basilensis]
MNERTLGIASYGLVGTGALVAGGYIAWLCGIKAGDIASWVQAIGSIAAIVGAYAIGERQASAAAKAQEAAETRDVRRRRDTYLAVAAVAVEQAHVAQANLFLPDFTVNPAPFIFDDVKAVAESVNEVRRAVVAIPLHEVGVAEAIAALSNLTNGLAGLSGTIVEADRAYREANERGAAFFPGYYPGRARMQIDEIDASYEKLQASLVGT